MRRDVRPYWVKRLYLKFRAFWIWWFLAPRCESLGPFNHYVPWFVIISGPNIRIGHSFTAIGEMHHQSKLAYGAAILAKGVSRLAMLA